MCMPPQVSSTTIITKYHHHPLTCPIIITSITINHLDHHQSPQSPSISSMNEPPITDGDWVPLPRRKNNSSQRASWTSMVNPMKKHPRNICVPWRPPPPREQKQQLGRRKQVRRRRKQVRRRRHLQQMVPQQQRRRPRRRRKRYCCCVRVFLGGVHKVYTRYTRYMVT